jgi:hypothetical protein
MWSVKTSSVRFLVPFMSKYLPQQPFLRHIHSLFFTVDKRLVMNYGHLIQFK